MLAPSGPFRFGESTSPSSSRVDTDKMAGLQLLLITTLAYSGRAATNNL